MSINSDHVMIVKSSAFKDLISSIVGFLNNKNLLLGIKQGLGFLIVSGTVGFISGLSRDAFRRVNQSFFVTVTIDSKDKSFDALLQWLSGCESVKTATQLNAETIYNAAGKNPRVVFAPSLGRHRISYRERTIFVNRIRDSTFDMSSGAPFESIELSTFGNDTSIIQQLIDEAMRLSLQKDEGKTVVYINSDGNWQRFGNPRTIRSLSSVILPSTLKNNLLKDIKEFIDNEDWFRNRGIPYRRGYLLYGAPGNGKSSLVNAIAGELSLDICIVSLSTRDMDDKQINYLLNNAPPKSILLIEDVDAAFSVRDKSGENAFQQSSLTFSGVLNALDGVASQEGRILFMTTNKIEQLDPALIRDGRIDMKIHIENATRQQALDLFCHFYTIKPNQPEFELAKQFSSNIPHSKQLSMSQIQGFLLQYKNSPEDATKNSFQFKDSE
ncbi:mitochondrial chaperone BCS1 [Heterostelium album PN500]|uniref:Mitochondrial chaperone BCS1 n=1 Tax=Heterostelium pallidum (strain ATCC 26659 / Pp 5 / PN500) TaxID=670386 RepID=D3BQA0_HETP5|nr:mitochondrial chaperone BCS1 [Heterostelium album PN500]EFA76320.1 mitochondrial chaperone BCS1 [Heterostelium album PN500]|eukprot:XP_020428452.1 mitochondrial chaperone BCS1 [Heterostelium album PN500]